MKLRKLLIGIKIWISRSQQYIAIVNVGMVFFLFLSKMNESGYTSLTVGKYWLPLYLLGLGLAVLFGYIEVKVLRGLPEELGLVFAMNPFMIDLKARLKRIEKAQNKTGKTTTTKPKGMQE